jgi:gliding motility-associated-like protein
LTTGSASAAELIVDFKADKVCFGSVTTMISLSTVDEGDSIRFILWDFNGDGNFDNAEGDTVIFPFPYPGFHTVGLKVMTWGGLSKAIYKQVTVGDLYVNFSFNNGCRNQPIQFHNESVVSGDTAFVYYWNFGDGSASSQLENPVHSYTEPGIYEPKLYVGTYAGCYDSLTRSITIGVPPEIDLQFSGDTVFSEGDSVIAYVTGVYDSVQWSTGATGSAIVIDYQGVFWVRIYSQGCSSETSFHTTVIQSGNDPVIMTLFTPNGDGSNDHWKILNLFKVGPCDVSIYDRWGEKVYTNPEYGNDWDGSFKGKPLSNATYYYFVRCFDGNLYQGTVNIIK